jgi:hypothetical protein
VSEGAGSNNKNDDMAAEPVVTPTSKALGKRGSEYVETLDDIELGDGEASTTKEPKIQAIDVDDSQTQ